jgi:hypothetical protein
MTPFSLLFVSFQIDIPKFTVNKSTWIYQWNLVSSIIIFIITLQIYYHYEHARVSIIKRFYESSIY